MVENKYNFYFASISDNKETNGSYAIDYFTKPTILLHFIFVQR